MSTRTTLRPMQVVTAGNMASNITSATTILGSITGVSYTVSWTGTSPVGTLSVQGSGDYSIEPNGAVNNAGTWTSLLLNVNGTPATTIAVSGNSGSEFIDITKTMAYALRLIYTAASGTGTLNATINGKVS